MQSKLITLAVAMLFCLSAGQETIQGMRKVQGGLVTWKNSVTGSYHTRIRILSGQVSLDTSTTGQAGQWKRIDNTVDSCSREIFLASDSLGMTAPVWLFRLSGIVKAHDVDSSTHVYRIPTRILHNYGVGSSLKRAWRPWSRPAKNNGISEVTVQDTCLMKSLSGVTANSTVEQYCMATLFGTQAKLCPDNITGTATVSTDSIIIDSLIYEGR